MIDPKKTYRTRDGCEVRIYAVDGDMPYIVHGAIKYPCGWNPATWTDNGAYDADNSNPDAMDLIEVRPRIHREVWVNVYPDMRGVDGYVTSREYADRCADEGRIACVKLVIDCEEGHGLD